MSRVYKVTMEFTPRDYQIWTNNLPAGHHSFKFEIVEPVGNGEDHDPSFVERQTAPKPPPKVRAKRRTKAEMEAARAASA